MRAAALAACAAPMASAALSADLVIASWGGDYAEAQKTAFIQPWMKRTGKTAEVVAFDGAVAGLQSQVEQGAVEWDVVDIERADARVLCDQGLLEPVSYNFV